MVKRFNGACQAKEAEAQGVRDVLQWLMGIQVEKVIVELDAKVVVDSLNSSQVDHSEFGQINAECSAQVQPHRSNFGFVKRQGNAGVDPVAREAVSGDSSGDGEFVPLVLVLLVSKDVTNFG